MTSADIFRNNLIEKILMISNEKYLLALSKLISASSEVNQLIKLSKEQELMLQMSENDILHYRTISQDDLINTTHRWLKNKNH